jgi:hypothetical protein
MLAAIRFQPDVAFDFAQRKQQRAIAHRQAGQKSVAPDMSQREAR